MMPGLRQRGVSVAQWLRLPGTAGAPECAAIRYWEDPTPLRRQPPRIPSGRSPVFFVHGYAGTEHIWGPLRDALSEAGFDHLIALRYNAFRADIHQIADWLVGQVNRSMQTTGAAGVHLIGHSMGGLVVRDAVQNRGLAAVADTAVTMATPHSGARLARFVPGPAARQMRPGSEFLSSLGTCRNDLGRTRWVTVHGGADRVVPPKSGEFDGVDHRVLTVRQDASGHGSIARHPQVVSCIVNEMLRSEAQGAESFSLAA
jgi:hypothetical protein